MENGLKGLYYLRTESKQRAEVVGDKVERHVLQEDTRSIIYGRNTCPYCTRAKEELSLRGMPFDFINLDEIGKTAAEVTGRKVKTVPQIYIEGKYVGGYNELMQFLNTSYKTTESEECRACEG